MYGTEWPDKIKKMDDIINPDLCVRYYKVPDSNLAEIWAPLITDVANGFNRKVGAVFGVDDSNDMRTLCVNSMTYPIFNTDGNGTLEACNGTGAPFDKVLETSSGSDGKSSDIPTDAPSDVPTDQI
jgi:hypothetical protein